MYLRLDLQIGKINSNSTLNITAVIINAPKLDSGIYAHKGIKKAKASKTSPPVYIPPAGVFTPLAAFTAVLENDPVVGIDWTNDPTRLQIPSAIISWLASICLPFANNQDNKII